MGQKVSNNAKKGLFSRIRSYFVAPVGSAGSLSALYNPNNIQFGVTVNTDAALRFTAVFAAIKLLAENIASLPKSVYKYTRRGSTEATSHPAWNILAVRPNSYTDRFSFWFNFVSDLVGKGNAYALIKFDAGRPVSIHRVNPDAVQISFSQGEKVYIVQDADSSFSWLNGTYLEHEMIHVMYYTRNGIIGVDPIAYNAVSIGRGIATQKFSAEFYNRGGQIKGTLETDGSLGEVEYENFLRHYNQAAQNFETPLLEYGIKYKNIGISPVAAQLIQSETLSIQDIARMYGLPPHLLGELSHATFSNIEQQNIFFGSYSLRPLCKRIEEQLEVKLFAESELNKFDVKFDLRGIMRGDDGARANYYQSAINAGWMTPNEARAYEGMTALPGLDKPWAPLNTGYVDEGGNIVNPNGGETQKNNTNTEEI